MFPFSTENYYFLHTGTKKGTFFIFFLKKRERERQGFGLFFYLVNFFFEKYYLKKIIKTKKIIKIKKIIK